MANFLKILTESPFLATFWHFLATFVLLSFSGSKDKDGETKEEELSEYEKKRMTIAECKKSLPVYPFRQSLLDAIEEHQVLIIEGETGTVVIK